MSSDTSSPHSAGTPASHAPSAGNGSCGGAATQEQRHVDVLIVGQGIAGSVLAYTLIEAGLSVCVIDDGHKTSASTVAAGMVNPVLGQRLNKAWEIEKCLPVAIALYQRIEQRFGNRFFFPKRILKLLNTENEAAYLQKRLEDPDFAPFLGTAHPPHANAEGIVADSNRNPANSAQQPQAGSAATHAAAANSLRDELGSIEITGGGYLDARAMLATLREHFATEGVLMQAPFDHAELELAAAGGVRWRNITASRIVFAEGWRILNNPFFAAYSFQATKGQILTVQSAQPLPDFVVNRAKWLIPQGAQQAWIGSTYERDQTDPVTTEEGRREILNKVQAFLPRNPLSVVDQRAGIRLACHDHIPRVGFLPAESRIGIFNAFSSKGNCFAPYLAQCMAEYLLNGTPLPHKADIGKKKIRKEDGTAKS